MFSPQWPSRKREREDNEEEIGTGFGEHRTKRRIASLPHRVSPKSKIHHVVPISWGGPAPPTITPADSDSEDVLGSEPKSFFSPYSSSPATAAIVQSTPPSPTLNDIPMSQASQPTQMSMLDAPLYSDEMEMGDSFHLSPPSFHNDPSLSISGRIPTPIHSSFAPFIRAEKATMHHDSDFADDEAVVDRFRRGRRLPSPISEGEMSPSVIVAGFNDMQMEVESPSQPDFLRDTPTKKGHTRSKHSLRTWTGNGGEPMSGSGMKRSFSMGYRADCEKCRMKVPGHFSHIITY